MKLCILGVSIVKHFKGKLYSHSNARVQLDCVPVCTVAVWYLVYSIALGYCVQGGLIPENNLKLLLTNPESIIPF